LYAAAGVDTFVPPDKKIVCTSTTSVTRGQNHISPMLKSSYEVWQLRNNRLTADSTGAHGASAQKE
ncbi:MAG: hypothetical protein ABJQ14_09205, partial [Hyphomicrobiales bacterium]